MYKRQLGIYPAVDPLESTSRILDPLIVGKEHYETAQRVKQILQRNKELQDIISILDVYKRQLFTKVFRAISVFNEKET